MIPDKVDGVIICRALISFALGNASTIKAQLSNIAVMVNRRRDIVLCAGQTAHSFSKQMPASKTDSALYFTTYMIFWEARAVITTTAWILTISNEASFEDCM